MEFKNPKQKQNDVVLKIAKQVIDSVANGSNLVFSPTSINVLLSLIAAGSSSITKAQILSFLMSPSTEHLNAVLAHIIDGGPAERSDLRLTMANGVWFDKSVSIKPAFKEIVENSYKATCSQVDFATKPAKVIDEVNTWADVHTNGLIKNILSHNSIKDIRDSTLVLTNALYFKAAWSRTFDKTMTKDNDFHLLDGDTVRVPFMTSHKKQYVQRFDGFQLLRLPYVEDQRQFSMYIYLPDDKDGLPSLLERIGSEPDFLDNYFTLDRISVGVLRIPKFKFSFEFKASDVLKDMGLTLPFDTRGHLSEMVDSPSNLYVSSIIHKACIEVDEEGTVAAAVSAARAKPCCFVIHPDFIADHPFLFMVREEKSGLILFMGQVLDPCKH